MESLKRRFIYTESAPIVDIYYGTGLTATVTSSYITSTFSTVSGTIGTPTGRLYTFGTTFGTYRYWAIPDLPNTGDRVINEAKYTDGSTTLVLLPTQTSYYSYFQADPTPCCQSIRYGKLDINGVTYRVYRTLNTYNSSRTQFLIYSF